MSLPHSESDLSRIYEQRFADSVEYRKRVWRVLIDSFFQRYIPLDAAVLDLGCGYGEFINQVRARQKYAMDLNPDAPRYLADDVKFIGQDCSQPWAIQEGSLGVIFTSNFFEHLPDKPSLGRTLDQVEKALKPGGRLIAIGPNVKYLPGSYWDFWDHYVPLTELSLGEALQTRGFRMILQCGRFLPYTMSGKKAVPVLAIRSYLKLPLVWRFFGKQFLLIAEKPPKLS